MKKILKWAAIGIAVFVGGCTMISVGVSVGTVDNSPAQHQLSEKQVEKKQDKAMEAEKKAAPKEQHENHVPALQDAESEIQSYYDASTAGDFIYTYNHLTYEARQKYTQQQWIDINNSLGSLGAEYLIANVVSDQPNTYQVDLLVNDTYRTVYFVKDGGEYYHSPTQQEYNLYDGGLSSQADSGSSAAPVGSESDVQVKVVVSADAPVDVSVISMDKDVPMMEEQTASKTYTFYANPNQDLSVSASSQDFDFNSDDNISVKVYEDGSLVAEDTDPMMATVSY